MKTEASRTVWIGNKTFQKEIVSTGNGKVVEHEGKIISVKFYMIGMDGKFQYIA